MLSPPILRGSVRASLKLAPPQLIILNGHIHSGGETFELFLSSKNNMPDTAGASSQVLLVTASYDRTLRFWEALSGICSRTIQHPDSQVNRLSISNDKRFVAAAGNPNVRIYEALGANPNPLATLEGHTTNVTGVAFQNNSRWIVTGSEDGTVKIFDLRYEQCYC